MGQVESGTAAAEDAAETTASSPSVSVANDNSSQSLPSLDSLIAEAAAFGDEAGNESLEAKAQKALECPCIAHLRSGPCGSQFSDAFLCFLKSTAEEKGSDCVNPFVALQNCIKAHPGAFSKEILENEDIQKEEKSAQEYRIYPPLWSVESKKSKKSKKSET
ncbi:hypothetical protein M9H77_08649 [Catharanthus roseus]|uniref:Uncharacterized protein n=1 Tax=Catharanthus roseus TaxID=4058 RepID=A0ACC0BYP2_CATRO|nr:hypothetical protein M9H77_08649 [Catharanthus roseus]